MSFQIAITKVPANYPYAHAPVASLNSDLAILAGAGTEWAERLRRMASGAPGLDIFSEGFVVPDPKGWRLTDVARKRLSLLEALAAARTS